jgi:transposase
VETAEAFGISVSVIKKLQKQLKEKGNLEPAELKRSGRKIKKAELEADVELYPEDFNRERALRFKCTEEGMRKAMKRHKITRKKR